MGSLDKTTLFRLISVLLCFLVTACQVPGPETTADTAAVESISSGLTGPSTYYVVRHADKAEQTPGFEFDDETPLNPAGMQRALDLREYFKRSKLSAVYTTNTARSWMTAAPIAESRGLAITRYDDPLVWLPKWRDGHRGEEALIVSHAGWVEQIVEGLSGVTVDPVGNEFDNLFVVNVDDGSATVKHLYYGAFASLAGVPVTGDVVRHQKYAGHIENFSAVERVGEYVLIGPDEGTEIFVAAYDGTQLTVDATINLDVLNDDEIDIEGIAHDGNTVYVTGSHSYRRKNIHSDSRADATDSELREDYAEPDRERNRERLFRIVIDPATGAAVSAAEELPSLTPVMREEGQVLDAFAKVPSKENGVDIEGLTFMDGKLFAGFRGPVLRFNYTPVLVFEPADRNEVQIRFVKLDGLGIRGMATTEDGILILAGPVGDGPGGYFLYHWDGEDCFPEEVREGRATPLGTTTLLGRVSTPADAKAEGITVMQSGGDFYDVLIVFDGPENGDPTKLRVHKLP